MGHETISEGAIMMFLLFFSFMPSAFSEVFTSSEKLARLAEREVSLLRRLRSYETEISLPR